MNRAPQSDDRPATPPDRAHGGVAAAHARALILLQQRRPADAAAALREALAREPGDARAHELLAIAWRQLDQPAPAVAAAREAVRLDPKNAGFLATLAGALHAAGEAREAEAVARSAVTAAPDDPHARAQLGGLLLARGALREALAQAEAGLRVRPEHEACERVRTRALYKLGRRAEAATTVRERLRRAPNDAAAHVDAGFADLHAGAAPRAAVHFREALRLEPNNVAARAGLANAITGQRPLLGRLLRALLFLSRLPLPLVVGALILFAFSPELIRAVAGAGPGATLVADVADVAYVALVALFIAGLPLVDVALRFDRENRHVLSDDQRAAVRWHAPLLLLALLATPLVAFWRHPGAVTVLMFVTITVPITVLYRLREPLRRAMWRYVALVALLGAVPVGLMWTVILVDATRGWAATLDAAPAAVLLGLWLLMKLQTPMLLACFAGAALSGRYARRLVRRGHANVPRAR